MTAPGVHVALAALAFAAALVSAAQCFRGEPVAVGPWRDYVTLTKPRIMSLLLVTGAAGMFVGAAACRRSALFAAAMVGLALACGGASALNHVLDRDIDRLMGKRTEQRPVAAGRVPPARALEFGLALSALSFVLLASAVNVLDGGARARREPLLRPRLHALAEALDAAEHRHRRRRRRGAAARRLRGRDREPRRCPRSGSS